MAGALIQRDGPVAAPMDYLVPTASDMQLLALTATFDGSSAASTFEPTLQVIAPNGAVVAQCPVSTPVAAGGSATVCWFPWRRGVAQATTPPPTPLGTLIAWYDYSDASTISLDGSGKIQRINDKSGNGYNAIQATAARRPGQTIVNGLSAGLFASASTTCLSAPIFSSTYAQPFTVAFVVTQTIAGAGSYWPGFFTTPPGTSFPRLYVHHNENYLVMQIAGGPHIDTGAIAPFTQTMFVCCFDGATSYLRVNGSQINGSQSTTALEGVVMGTQYDGQILPGEVDFMDGACCEFMYFSGFLTGAPLVATEAYLRSKWGTP